MFLVCRFVQEIHELHCAGFQHHHHLVNPVYQYIVADVADNATLIISEKIMTHGKQHAETDFTVDLNGEGSSTNVISRSVARDDSTQLFKSNIRGNNKCAGNL